MTTDKKTTKKRTANEEALAALKKKYKTFFSKWLPMINQWSFDSEYTPWEERMEDTQTITLRNADLELMRTQFRNCIGVESYGKIDGDKRSDYFVAGRKHQVWFVAKRGNFGSVFFYLDVESGRQTPSIGQGLQSLLDNGALQSLDDIAFLVLGEERLWRFENEVNGYHDIREYLTPEQFKIPLPPVVDRQVHFTIVPQPKGGFAKLLSKVQEVTDSTSPSALTSWNHGAVRAASRWQDERKAAEKVSPVKRPKAQSPEKIKQLKKQFPFLGTAIWLEDTFDSRTRVDIKVRRADPTTMLYIGDRADGLRSSCSAREFPFQKGEYTEKVYAIRKDDKSVASMMWQGRNYDRSLKNIFECCRELCNVQPDDVRCLVRVMSWKWRSERLAEAHRWVSHFMGLDETDLPRPPVMNNEIYITIYMPPKQGFAKLLEESSLMTNVRLHSGIFLRGIICAEPEFVEANEALRSLAKEFERRVFATGLQQLIWDCKWHGMSGNFCKDKDIKVLSLCSAGSTMITMQRGDDQFTVIGPDKPCDNPEYKQGMGWQSIDATLPAATAIVNDVIAAWEDRVMVEDAMLPDEKVGMF